VTVEYHPKFVRRFFMATINATNIAHGMDIIGSCGNRIGAVDHVEGESIKVTKASSGDGQHHFIPLDWIERVDTHVHLTKDCGATRSDWKSENSLPSRN